MRLLLLTLLLFNLSSCYDMRDKSLERQADYQYQQVEQLKNIADQLRRLNDNIYNSKNIEFSDTLFLDTSNIIHVTQDFR